MEIRELNHIKERIGNSGGNVFVLDKGEVIDSEAEAMLQALHSRSTGGFENHLKVLQEKGAENFMSKFYVGYGHKSIGDCGSATIFIEGVSMLAAKAIQDSKLYNGQEASTRYVDFSKQKFINPIQKNDKNYKYGNEILEKQRNFYLSILEPLRNDLKNKFPRKENENEKLYEKTIFAKAFDMARGFLPAGASTNLAWHTNLRQISDRLLFLRHHPLREVQEIAIAVEKAVMKKFPNSFTTKRHEETEKYQELIAKQYYYHNPNQDGLTYYLDKFDFEKLNEFSELIKDRPEKTELPQYLNNLGEMEFSFNLDFGSFRDIQRHRAINQRMPLLTTEIGFNDFYLNSLPEHLREKAKEHLKGIEKAIKEFNLSSVESQYFIPMGYNTSNTFTGTLPAIVYMLELRASRFVHPTLRKVAYEISGVLEENGIKLNIDREGNSFDIKRGKHDIEMK